MSILKNPRAKCPRCGSTLKQPEYQCPKCGFGKIVLSTDPDEGTAPNFLPVYVSDELIHRVENTKSEIREVNRQISSLETVLGKSSLYVGYGGNSKRNPETGRYETLETVHVPIPQVVVEVVLAMLKQQVVDLEVRLEEIRNGRA